MYLEKQYKHQLLTEISRGEERCIGRSFQKTGKFALKKNVVY